MYGKGSCIEERIFLSCRQSIKPDKCSRDNLRNPPRSDSSLHQFFLSYQFISFFSATEKLFPLEYAKQKLWFFHINFSRPSLRARTILEKNQNWEVCFLCVQRKLWDDETPKALLFAQHHGLGGFTPLAWLAILS